ncbi:hypothetical protein QL285_079911 [Trifolium repens]|nr:hypothetical protein QL285_079911 [Trifolium repens]
MHSTYILFSSFFILKSSLQIYICSTSNLYMKLSQPLIISLLRITWGLINVHFKITLRSLFISGPMLSNCLQITNTDLCRQGRTQKFGAMGAYVYFTMVSNTSKK